MSGPSQPATASPSRTPRPFQCFHRRSHQASRSGLGSVVPETSGIANKRSASNQTSLEDTYSATVRGETTRPRGIWRLTLMRQIRSEGVVSILRSKRVWNGVNLVTSTAERTSSVMTNLMVERPARYASCRELLGSISSAGPTMSKTGASSTRSERTIPTTEQRWKQGEHLQCDVIPNSQRNQGNLRARTDKSGRMTPCSER